MTTAPEQRPEHVVLKYLADYRGDDPFLLSLRRWVGQGRKLTVRQLDGAWRAIGRLTDQQELELRLYREIMKAAHPDLATDDGDRRWRTRLTVIANRAHAENNLPALVWLRALLAS